MKSMDTTDLNLLTEQIFRDAAFGLIVLTIVLASNAFLFIQIYLWYVRSCAILLNAKNFSLIMRFVVAVLLMSLVQVASILIWTVALFSIGLIEDPRSAMLFAGSCYTTLGIFSDLLPQGWKSVAFYIAFSGLFSFAIATSSMISMISIITKKIYKTVKKV
ncbi:hypothetical protein [Zwartia sp.]|uniref:hypothetical protein n=1 Tax=Zwartia sp. TaxID=2978004 RepID=UPI003BB08F6D